MRSNVCKHTISLDTINWAIYSIYSTKSFIKHPRKHVLALLCFVLLRQMSISPISFGITLTHWGRVTHICVVKLTIIGSDNGLSPGRRQAIIWTNAGILLIGPLETNFIEILIGIQTFSFRKMDLKMSSAKWRLFCLGLNGLTALGLNGNDENTGNNNIAEIMECAWYLYNHSCPVDALMPRQNDHHFGDDIFKCILLN